MKKIYNFLNNNTMKNLIFSLISLIFSFNCTSQGVVINSDGSNPNSSAILDVKSTTKGILIPRMTQTQRNAIDTPVSGLMVYQTDATLGFYFYDGSSWVRLASGTEAAYTAGTNISISGNVITNSSPDQTVTLTGGGATSITGTYPNFTINSTDNNSGGTVTSLTAGTGLSGGTITSSGTINLANTGVTTGTYNNVTVNAQGQVTAGSNTSYLTSEVDDIIGNEVTNATTSGGLSRSGSGTNVDPYTLGIDTDGVTSDMILDATVTGTDIASGTVTSTNITDGTIATADVANNAITGTKINLTSNATGDMMYYDGTNWVRIAAGTSGQILVAAGAAAPAWTTKYSKYTLNNSVSATAASTTGANNNAVYGVGVTYYGAINPGTTAISLSSAVTSSILRSDGSDYLLSYEGWIINQTSNALTMGIYVVKYAAGNTTQTTGTSAGTLIGSTTTLAVAAGTNYASKFTLDLSSTQLSANDVVVIFVRNLSGGNRTYYHQGQLNVLRAF